MNSGNLVYKTYDISTSVEYTSGTRLNLSGVRIIKLVNRPAGVQVWISTDSNGTNLFPLINRGDGWDLPQDMPPLYDLYVFTKGVNSQDKLILTYTGEKNFFIFGSNSIEKVGEIESLGEQARLDINNSISNYYNRIAYTNDNKVFSKAFTGEILFANVGSVDTTRYVCFPLSATGLVKELQLNDNDFYRFSIQGHIDGMSDATATWLGSSSGNSSCVEVVHISLFNNTQSANFTAVQDQEIENLYKLDKRPCQHTDKFDLFGIKSVSHGTVFFTNGQPEINVDIIMPGSAINKYQYFGIFFSYDTWSDAGFLLNPSMHCSLIFTISKAISYVTITNELPTEANRWIDSNLVSLKYYSNDTKRVDYLIERYKEIALTNETLTTEEVKKEATAGIPIAEEIFNVLVNGIKMNDPNAETYKTMLNTYALTIYQYYRAWKRIEFLNPVVKTETEKQRLETAISSLNKTNYVNDWHWCNDPMGLIEYLKELGIVVDISKV